MKEENGFTAEDRLLDNGYEGVVMLHNYSYDDALIGVTSDNRAVYDYNKMVEWLVLHEDFSETEAIEWIDYNTVRALCYAGEDAPIVMYPLMDFQENCADVKVPDEYDMFNFLNSCSE